MSSQLHLLFPSKKWIQTGTYLAWISWEKSNRKTVLKSVKKNKKWVKLSFQPLNLFAARVNSAAQSESWGSSEIHFTLCCICVSSSWRLRVCWHISSPLKRAAMLGFFVQLLLKHSEKKCFFSLYADNAVVSHGQIWNKQTDLQSARFWSCSGKTGQLSSSGRRRASHPVSAL